MTALDEFEENVLVQCTACRFLGAGTIDAQATRLEFHGGRLKRFRDGKLITPPVHDSCGGRLRIFRATRNEPERRAA